MALPVNPVDVLSAVLEGDGEMLPERILAGLLQTWDDPATGEPLRVLARAAVADAELGRLVADAIGTEVIGRVAARIGGRGATARDGVRNPDSRPDHEPLPDRNRTACVDARRTGRATPRAYFALHSRDLAGQGLNALVMK
jgi:hypothetical protein